MGLQKKNEYNLDGSSILTNWISLYKPIPLKEKSNPNISLTNLYPYKY
jgi:hypothetical protein